MMLSMQSFSSPTFEFWSLAITRLTSTIITVWALSVLIGIWRRQDPCPAKRLVPRPVILFTAGWLSVLTFITGLLVMSGSEAISAGWFRAVYGMSFVWSIAGLAWMIAIGDRAVKIMQAQQEVKKVVEK